MDRDLEVVRMEQADAGKPVQPAGAPERIAMLYRRMIAARGPGRSPARSPALDLPDLAGCYDTDL